MAPAAPPGQPWCSVSGDVPRCPTCRGRAPPHRRAAVRCRCAAASPLTRVPACAWQEPPPPAACLPPCRPRFVRHASFPPSPHQGAAHAGRAGHGPHRQQRHPLGLARQGAAAQGPRGGAFPRCRLARVRGGARAVRWGRAAAARLWLLLAAALPGAAAARLGWGSSQLERVSALTRLSFLQL